MTNKQTTPENAKASDQLNEAGQKANDRLEKPPDANAIRNATGQHIEAALEANTNIWQSDHGLFAITDGGETIAKQKPRRPTETPINQEAAQQQPSRLQISKSSTDPSFLAPLCSKPLHGGNRYVHTTFGRVA